MAVLDDPQPGAPQPLRRRASDGPAVRIAAALIGLVLTVLILKQLASLLQPLFIAVLFYYLGAPLARWLLRHKVPSALANGAILIVALLVLVALGWVIGAHVDQVQERLPHYNTQLRQLLESSFGWLAERLPDQGRPLRQVFVNQVLDQASLAAVVRRVLAALLGSITAPLLILIYLLFINIEAATLPRRLMAAYGAERARQLLEVATRINDAIIRYVYVKGVASLLVALLSTATMLFFRLDLAVLWGVFTFFGNFIPYLGSAVAVALPVTIALLQTGSVGTTVLLAALLLAWQTLVASYLEPRMAGRSLNLSPLVILLSLAFWFWLWGIVGMLLAIPLMMGIKLVLENIPATRSLAILISEGAPRRSQPPRPERGSSSAVA